MPFINFQASGTLIAAHHYRDDKFVILVNTGSTPHPYCYSTYTNGASEWDSGNHMGDYDLALDGYHKRVRELEREAKPELFKFTEA